jgi:hypothetical protein
MTEYSPFCVSRFVFRVSCFAFRVSRFVFRVSRFVFRVSYLKRFENLEFEI